MTHGGKHCIAIMVEEGWKQRFGLTFGVCVLVWLVLLGAVALDPRVHAASLKLPLDSGHAEAAPPPPRTVPYQKEWGETGSEDISMHDPRVVKTAGPLEPEQIHIALAGARNYYAQTKSKLGVGCVAGVCGRAL